jgi:hypothetical protein
MTIRSKSVIAVSEHQVRFFKDILDASQLFHQGFVAARYWAIRRDHGENRSMKGIGSFKRLNAELTGRCDLIEGVEKLRTEMSQDFRRQRSYRTSGVSAEQSRPRRRLPRSARGNSTSRKSGLNKWSVHTPWVMISAMKTMGGSAGRARASFHKSRWFACRPPDPVTMTMFSVGFLAVP